MPRILTRLWLLLTLLVAGQALALGLGDIRLNSALNEPLRAEIALLVAAPEELDNLTVQMASAETFERYGLDRPLFLNDMQFDVFKSGTASGNLIRVTSAASISEPFVTFLVEAAWQRGRLLREYTVLLDPPTYAPAPLTRSTQAVTAPSRSSAADAGRIERPATTQASPPPPVSRPPVPDREAAQIPAQEPPPTPVVTARPARTFDATPGEDFQVQRGDTLWGIASRVRPDKGITVNQMMMALFEANPDAFSNNINVLRAGATLNIPSADTVYRISRGEALSAVQEQNDAWGGRGPGSLTRTEPSLTLVPPDEDQTGYDADTGTFDTDYNREFEVEDRILELEADVPTQDSLIEIRDNELARLRAELARIRGEEPVTLPSADELPAADVDAADDGVIDDDQIFVDDEATDVVVEDDAAIAADSENVVADQTVDTAPPPPVVAPVTPEATLLDSILDRVLSIWGAIAGAIIAVFGILVWFARRAGRDDEDPTGLWSELDADESDTEVVSQTQQLKSLGRDEESAMVVVEQESKAAMAAEMAADVVPAIETAADPLEGIASSDTAGIEQTLEDTFSSDSAINLDQSDPIAEADFHMAYGLHDQAADLINSALEAEPEREDLLAKLCEVYFVWGNRDAFIDAAASMKSVIGDAANAEWGKIIIMGQQISGDHKMFSGKIAGAMTQAVDLALDEGTQEVGVLDLDLAEGPDGAVSDIIDLGMPSEDQAASPDPSGIDFFLEADDTSTSATGKMPSSDPVTIDTPALSDAANETSGDLPDAESTVETPTIEHQFKNLDVTAEVPALPEADEATVVATLEDELPSTDATAEIDLDELGLNLDDLVAATGQGVAFDADAATLETDLPGDLEVAGENEAPALDDLEVIGENVTPVFDDLDATGETEVATFDDLAATGKNEAQTFDDLEATGKNPGLDATDTVDTTIDKPVLGDAIEPLSDADFGIDTSLLDATGQTQILSKDIAVDTASEEEAVIADDEQTLMAPLEGGLEFAKTEALPADIFAADPSADETGELPNLVGSTDLDLDDLTAALKVSEVGDTIDQSFDDATVEQPSITPPGDSDFDDLVTTQALGPGALADDLNDARTMTEVGTKLDLARAYVDMGDPAGARSILEEVLDEGDDSQCQQAKQLLDSLPS